MAKAPAKAAVAAPVTPVNGEVEEAEELEAVEAEEEEEEEVVVSKAKKVKGPKRTKHVFMSEEAFEEAVRVYEEEFVPLFDEKQVAKMTNISLFMRDTVGWKAWGRLVGTGNPKRD
jgi:hypothetical protein